MSDLNLKRVAFWVLTEEDGTESVVDEKTLLEMKLDTSEKQKSALGLPDTAELKEVWIKKALGEHKSEIQLKCLDPNTMMYNPAKENAARFVVLVEKWNGFLMRPKTEEAYYALPICIANYLDAVLQQHMMPSAFNSPSFLKAYQQSQKNSEARNESPL